MRLQSHCARYLPAALVCIPSGLLLADPQCALALQYERARLAAQPWRVLSGHLVHLNGLHWAVNVAGWLLVLALFERELPARVQWLVLGISALTIGLGLFWWWPQIAWYRGLSGVLHGLCAAGALRWVLEAAQDARARRPHAGATLVLAASVLLGLWAKIALESWGPGLAYAQWLQGAVVTPAHALGALSGTAVAAGIQWSFRRRFKAEQ